MSLGLNWSFSSMFSDFQGAENRVFSTVKNAADRCLMSMCMWLPLILQQFGAEGEYLLAALLETHHSPGRTAQTHECHFSKRLQKWPWILQMQKHPLLNSFYSSCNTLNLYFNWKLWPFQHFEPPLKEVLLTTPPSFRCWKLWDQRWEWPYHF